MVSVAATEKHQPSNQPTICYPPPHMRILCEKRNERGGELNPQTGSTAQVEEEERRCGRTLRKSIKSVSYLYFMFNLL